MKKLIHLKILIVGLRGLGVEIAKNIIQKRKTQYLIMMVKIIKILKKKNKNKVFDEDKNKNESENK